MSKKTFDRILLAFLLLDLFASLSVVAALATGYLS